MVGNICCCRYAVNPCHQRAANDLTIHDYTDTQKMLSVSARSQMFAPHRDIYITRMSDRQVWTGTEKRPWTLKRRPAHGRVLLS